MKLTILGSGTDASQIPGIPNRFPPGFLIEEGSEKLLLECSEGIRFRLEQVGVDFTSIRHLAISHSHPDHYALPQFYQSVWNTGQWSNLKRIDHPLYIYGPRDLTENFPALWQKYHPDLPQMLPMPQLKFVSMPRAEAVKIGEIELQAFEVFHGFGKVGAVAYRVETPKGSVVYSGDTGDCKGVRQAAKNADIFICECSARIGDKISPKEYGHLNPWLAGDIVREAKAKKLVLFHYSGLDSDEEIIKDCRSSGFSGEIVIAKDFLIFEL